MTLSNGESSPPTRRSNGHLESPGGRVLCFFQFLSRKYTPRKEETSRNHQISRFHVSFRWCILFFFAFQIPSSQNFPIAPPASQLLANSKANRSSAATILHSVFGKINDDSNFGEFSNVGILNGNNWDHL